MAVTIGANIASLAARARLGRTSDLLSQTQERLSGGKRINKAADDSASLSIATGLTSQNRIYTQAIQNLNDNVSLLQTSESAVDQLIKIVTRMKELAVQSLQTSFTASQRSVAQKESDALVQEYNRIAQGSQFNGQSIFGTTSLTLSTTGGSDIVTVSAAGAGNGATNSGTFQTAVSAGTNGGPGAGKLVTDLNGDGYDDVETTNGSSIAVNYGSATGINRTVLSNSVGGGANLYLALDTAAGAPDVNGDGKSDLVVFDRNNATTNNGFMVALGNGDGTFANFAVAATQADVGSNTQFALGDLNGDGKTDLAYSYSDGTTYRLQVRYGQSGGTFGAATTLGSSSIFDGWAGPALADFNNDGSLDIAWRGAGDNTYILANNGNGTFSANNIGAGPHRWEAVTTGDINNDGRKDLIIRADNSIQTYINNNGSSFTSVSISGLGGGNSVAVKDLNGDGYNDVITVDSYLSTTINIRYGSSSGTLSSSASVDTGSQQNIVQVGDINGDGANDIIGSASAASSLAILYGNTQGAITIQSVDLGTVQQARSSLTDIDDLFNRLIVTRGIIGSSINRLLVETQSTSSAKLNSQFAVSGILDSDLAADSAEQVRLKILQQASASVLGQANQSPKIALKLLGI